ncbi:TPA: hypothetical protein HA239_03780 [Candidatus Woesearchaeota archaeon]|nr:hypothetical protein QT06_C0001G0827 [archaeon GW2011_AR15]MBS3103394.1 hypothetical protein [Candidatus Woesearchaeota archaeon]HIH41511.1 hypothetical protein [Candidatus Woesearchaeota archaeon]
MNKEKKKQLLNIARIVAIVLLLYVVLKGILVLSVLILLSLSMSYIINNYGLRQYGLELVTLVAVLTGVKYGPVPSLILTFILITYHMLAGGFFAKYVFWVIPAYTIAGFISGFFPATAVTALGLYATLGINISNTFFTAVTSPGYLFKYLPFAVTNVIFNVILFAVAARPLLLLMI